MKISACTYMSSYDAKNVYCQDVNEWIKNKYIDLLCPMIYTLDNNYFLECINDYKKNIPEKNGNIRCKKSNYVVLYLMMCELFLLF